MTTFVCVFSVAALLALINLDPVSTLDVPRACSRLLRCVSFDAPAVTSLASVTETQLLNQTCRRIPAAKRCVRKRQRRCPDQAVLDDANTQLQSMHYWCSREGREVLEEASQSVCAHRERRMRRLGSHLHNCHSIYDIQVEILELRSRSSGRDTLADCGLLAELRECMLRSTGRLCGSAFRSVIDISWRISYAQMQDRLRCPTIDEAEYGISGSLPNLPGSAGTGRPWRYTTSRRVNRP
ncbi:uncharacterized protein LOC101845924 [Aplysia californica]|uniref:Uncharacterized protein LOC101845924 n=1 Tax=Aplysia californica TaxID=6500 RepID=A0ABM0JQF7_APLCA|nr:uncharacterized protein LOC101845924 [Aplysia californica]